MPNTAIAPIQDQGKQAKASCSDDNQFIVNLKSLDRDKTKLMVHPCGCSTVKDMNKIEEDRSKRGFATWPAVEAFAKTKGATAVTPSQCKMPARPTSAAGGKPTPQADRGSATSATYTPESANRLLDASMDHKGARHHPGDHVPLNGENRAEMEKKAVARGKSITSFYLFREEAAQDIAKILNANRERVATLGAGRTMPLEKQPLIKAREIGVYSKNTGKITTDTAKVGTLILKNDEEGLHIVTFYPEAPPRRR